MKKNAKFYLDPYDYTLISPTVVVLYNISSCVATVINQRPDFRPSYITGRITYVVIIRRVPNYFFNYENIFLENNYWKINI